jgi:hypothetical protein
MNILVCGPESHFADDVHARCARCDAPIVHRPHVPPGLVKMCQACAAAHLIADGRPLEIHVTADTLREVALFNAKTKGNH